MTSCPITSVSIEASACHKCGQELRDKNQDFARIKRTWQPCADCFLKNYPEQDTNKYDLYGAKEQHYSLEEWFGKENKNYAVLPLILA